MSEGAIVDQTTKNAESKLSEYLRPTMWLTVAIAVLLAIFLGVFFLERLAAYAKSTEAATLLVFGGTLLAMLLLLTPIYQYVQNGLQRKREQIRGYYSPAVIAEYLNRFVIGSDDFSTAVASYRGNPSVQTEKLLKVKFETLLDGHFGRSRFWWPVVLLVVISGLVLFTAFGGGIELARHLTQVAAETALDAAAKVADPTERYYFGIKVDLTSIAAIFGAYCWITADALERYHQENMQPGDVIGYAFRLLIAVPIGQAVAIFAMSRDAQAQSIPVASLGPLVAFAFNALSYDQIIKLITGLSKKYLGTGAEQESNDLVIALPGVDCVLADRFRAEGITTIAQIAAADPLRLSIRTNQPFSLVLELIDEAILWNFVRANLPNLARLSWKGASHVLSFIDEAPAGSLAERMSGLETAVAASAAAHQELGPAVAAALAQPADATAQAALTQAQQLLAQAIAAVDAARSGINRSLADDDATFAQMAEASGMKPIELRGIVEDIRGNAYARLISKLMQVGATSSADPIAVKGAAAVPR